jgi:hypothetical protein
LRGNGSINKLSIAGQHPETTKREMLEAVFSILSSSRSQLKAVIAFLIAVSTGLRSKNYSAGERQQQFGGLDWSSDCQLVDSDG